MKKLLIISSLLLFGCEGGDFGDFSRSESYTINKGGDRSSPLEYEKVKGTSKFYADVIIQKGIYHLTDDNGNTLNDQGDWNKLTGFSDCNHWDAYRGMGAMIGWRWNLENENFEFAAYVHNKGDKSFKFKEFGTIAREGETLAIIIEARDNEYVFSLNGERIIMSGDFGRGCADSKIVGRLVNPYFGGNQKAPTTIKIDITYK